ncbi:hypothetical protein [Chelonobacter oris]|uniref:hypothetical protein n=1 Tax=Chelonobacter oris TaxID=505317 RepID=UPI00244974AA|nr:hypothetical protein [Chelonobacter oris]
MFDAGPQRHSLQFSSDETKATLTTLAALISSQIGPGKSLTLFPHRVFTYRAWSLQLVGELDTLPLLLNISGRFRLPLYADDARPARWIIDITDHIDAHWLVQYLRINLNLDCTPPHLSTLFGDKAVHNEGNHNV